MKSRGRVGGIWHFTFSSFMAAVLLCRAEDSAALQQKIADLERRLQQVEKGGAEEQKLAKLRDANKLAARRRAAQDRVEYKTEELKEIEALYQVANANWRTDKARDSLKTLLAKYDKSNRTGCATLYMGQMSSGDQRLEYLTRAVEKFSDCYYLNGCQVGGYGRYLLALTLWDRGEKDEAKKLLKEIQTDYKEAIHHSGRPVADLAQMAEKVLK